jgi:2Fe-2S ferredoxin
MAMINYIQPDGKEISVKVNSGDSVMQGAMDNMIDGIVAECGGGCSCATCHVYIDDAWMDKVGPAIDMEKEMLEAGTNMRPNSRLSCQVEVTDDLDGMTVRIPAEQY